MAKELEAVVSRTQARDYFTGSEVVGTRLDTYVLKTLPEDLLTVLRGVAGQELDAQITSGNEVTQILVDGRSVSRRGILQATRSVSMRFADTKLLISAIRDVYAALLRVTRIQVPPKNNIVARRNFYLYVNGKSVGLLPGALGRINETNTDYKTVLRIVGPLVPYGRKSYWNPIGRSRVMSIRQSVSLAGREVFHYGTAFEPRFKPYRMRTIRKLANAQGGDTAANLRKLLSSRPGNVEGAGQIVRRVMNRDRRYTSMYFSDAWVSYAPAASWGKNSKDDRVPSVSVQFARRGGVKLISSM